MCLTPFDPPFADLWDEIRPKWVIGPSGWTNAKLEAVRLDQDAYRQRQADKGRKSAAHRANPTEPQPEINHGLTVVQPAFQPEGQPDTQPELNPSPLTFDLDLGSSSLSLPESAEPRAQGEPAEITAILSKPAFDRTQDENEALAEHRGMTLLPRGTKPVRVRTGVDASVNDHCRCQGFGTLPSCSRGKALCIPAFVGQEWLDQCAGRVELVAQFVSDVVRSVPEGQPIGDPVKFWRAKWDAAHRQPTERVGKGAQAAAEGRKLLERYAAEGRLS